MPAKPPLRKSRQGFPRRFVPLRLGGGALRRYLRAAQAYMLISMPTDTSTILGVFQAILALSLVKKTGRTLYM